MRTNDKTVTEAVAEAAGVSPGSVFVEEDQGYVLINHQDSMRWSKETKAAVKAAATKLTGLPAQIT